jgi:regulator of sirC expression with transglutaminase-like and TPR domain
LLKANSLAKGKKSEINWQLALLYNHLKRNREAINEIETYLKLEPNSPDKTKIRELIEKLKACADGK